MTDWTNQPPSMIYKNTSFIIEDGMVDFLGHIALDFDRLVATFRTWWSFVRQFKVNNQLLVSNDTRTGLDAVHFKTESVTDGNDIIVRIVHRLLHLQYILI